jgi:large subunit ribosomal protein L30
MAKRRESKPIEGKRVTVTLNKSVIGFNRTQGKTIEGMGLRKIRQSVELPDTAETRGMILKVRHLITVTE